jgi:hypothetical protein
MLDLYRIHKPRKPTDVRDKKQAPVFHGFFPKVSNTSSFEFISICGQDLMREQHVADQALHQRRLRIEHVNSSVKRCRIVKDRIRLWKQDIRDLVMALCCALHNFRVRLSPWQPMI